MKTKFIIKINMKLIVTHKMIAMNTQIILCITSLVAVSLGKSVLISSNHLKGWRFSLFITSVFFKSSRAELFGKHGVGGLHTVGV